MRTSKTFFTLTFTLFCLSPLTAKPPKPPKTVSAEEAKAAQERLKQVGGTLKTVKKKMSAVQHKIKVVKVKERQYTENIHDLEARLDKTKSRLNTVKVKMRKLGAEHDVVVMRLSDTQIRLKQRKDLLASRLRDNYQRGQATYAQTLIQSRSLNDLLSRGQYVRQIVTSDTELIQGVKRDVGQIKADKQALEEQQQRQNALAAEFEQRKQEYAQEKQEQGVLLAGAQEVRQEAQEELDELEEAAAEMTDRVRQLSSVLHRRREIERAMMMAARQRQKSGDHTPLPKSELPEWHGSFRTPVNGRLMSGFGYRFHPILHRRKMHTGVDIAAPSGTSIHAAGSGVVILSAYYRGYGNAVIIDHGNNVTTLYGHCSALLVSEGQSVKVGQVIARVGATGMATGPHLHWEVRRNGTPVSPL